jgi:hypothetical protein
VVVDKLGQRQPARPVILFEIDKAPQVVLQGLVLSLRLSLCLRVERRGQPSSRAKVVAERGSKLTCKKTASVADQVPGHSHERIRMNQEKLSQLKRVCVLSARHIDTHFVSGSTKTMTAS